ncbi:MAG: ADP-glyceromanno-heptose 6-epimerase [Candidatus Ratteibacteria bacterium]|nr:ADP-glyceromanno-heptose 6-epimerase [Candidatus Ratteibacteria bacterium]
MIIVTGGAGFIGSSIVWGLNLKGRNQILIVDLLDNSKKWQNLAHLKFLDSIDRDKFIEKLSTGRLNNKIEGIIHMGAESSTTVSDIDYLMENNCEYTKRLAAWCVENNKRFVYASSAATYGNGKNGFSDEHSKLGQLKPLNPYAHSKHSFDLWAYKEGLLEKIAGLKYFNCFGPNEYHKAGMRSIALKAFEQIRRDGKVKLFKSYSPKYKDGEQLRDFVYIKDAIDMTLFIFENGKANGIFNVGTGRAKTFNELVESVFESMGKPVNIEYIDMPSSLEDKYQYFTQADMAKMKKTGYKNKIHTLQESVCDYVKNYLLKGNLCLGNEANNIG